MAASMSAKQQTAMQILVDRINAVEAAKAAAQVPPAVYVPMTAQQLAEQRKDELFDGYANQLEDEDAADFRTRFRAASKAKRDAAKAALA